MITVTAQQILARMAANDPIRPQIEALAGLNFRMDSHDGAGWTTEYDDGLPHAFMADSPMAAIEMALADLNQRLAQTVESKL